MPCWFILTSILVMMLPIFIFWNVRVSMARRFALGGVFSLVITTIVIAIVCVTVTTNGNRISRANKQVESSWFYTCHFVESSVGMYPSSIKFSHSVLTYCSHHCRLPCIVPYPFHHQRAHTRSRGSHAARTRDG
jgi:hypothetical protein